MKEFSASVVRLVGLLGVLIFFSGCAFLPKMDEKSDEYLYGISSTPAGSRILLDGVDVGITPAELKLHAYKRWVGILFESGGYRYENNRYYLRVISQDGILEDTAYIDPRNPEAGRKLHLTLTQTKKNDSHGQGKVLGIEEPFFPTFKSTGYIRIVGINGVSAGEWGGNEKEVVLPAGQYHLGAICKWDLGIGGEISFEYFWPVKLQVAANKEYQLKTEIIGKQRCSVSAANGVGDN